MRVGDGPICVSYRPDKDGSGPGSFKNIIILDFAISLSALTWAYESLKKPTSLEQDKILLCYYLVTLFTGGHSRSMSRIFKKNL